jgi:hypothetical protein
MRKVASGFEDDAHYSLTPSGRACPRGRRPLRLSPDERKDALANRLPRRTTARIACTATTGHSKTPPAVPEMLATARTAAVNMSNATYPRTMRRSGGLALTDAPAIPRPTRAPPRTLPTTVEVAPPSVPTSAPITTLGIASKASPVTTSTAALKRITSRATRSPLTGLVRRPRSVDRIAHHLRRARGAIHRTPPGV